MSFNNYRPSTDQESGQVLCWASNDLGEQMEPCVFHVVPLSTPQPPSACEVKPSILFVVHEICRNDYKFDKISKKLLKSTLV